MDWDFETPEEAALDGFDAADKAKVMGVEMKNADHIVVQVGFPRKSACYFVSAYQADGRWRA